MILYGLVKEQIEERQQKREAIGEARGEARGRKLGEAHGRELERREWLEWDARRKIAEAAGEEFTEPIPAEKRNDAPDNKSDTQV